MGETFRYINVGDDSYKREPGKTEGLKETSYNYASINFSILDLDGKKTPYYSDYNGPLTIINVVSHGFMLGQNRLGKDYTNTLGYGYFSTSKPTPVPFGEEVEIEFIMNPDWTHYRSHTSDTFIQGLTSQTKDNEFYSSLETWTKDDDFMANDLEVGDIVRCIDWEGNKFEWEVATKTPYKDHGMIVTSVDANMGGFGKKDDIFPFTMERVKPWLEGGGEATNLLKVGDTPISTAFVADTAVSKIYAGNTLVFGAVEGGPALNPAVEVVAQDDGAWIDGTFTKIYDITNTGDCDLFVEGGLRVPEGYRLTPNETITATYTSVEEGKPDTLYLNFRMEDGFRFTTWEEEITTPPFTWTAGNYPTQDGEFRYYTQRGGMLIITFDKTFNPGWEVGKDYQINHSKMGDLGLHTLLDYDGSVSPSTDCRLTFLDAGWGTEGNGIFEVGTTLTLLKSPLLIEEEFGYNGSTPNVGNIYSSTSYLRLNPADGARWEAAMEIGCDAMISIVGESYYTRRYFGFNRISKSSSNWSFYFDSYLGNMANSSSYRYDLSAYKAGRLPE